jgi:hypothetical protein
VTISHTWDIISLEYADTDVLVRVVNHINWICISHDSAGHTCSKNGSKQLDAPDPDSFTPFDTLAETDVLEWLGDEFIAATEAVNAAAIQKLIYAEASSAGTGVPW